MTEEPPKESKYEATALQVLLNLMEEKGYVEHPSKIQNDTDENASKKMD